MKSLATPPTCPWASTPSIPPGRPWPRSGPSTWPGCSFPRASATLAGCSSTASAPGSTWWSRYPHAGPLLGQPIQTQLIAEHWNDLLRLVGSMKFGHATASLLIAKLHASRRQSSLARALHEYGKLVRTIYVCRYVADEELRRRVRRQPNKGESLHALRRDLFFAHQGHVRRRHLDDQIDQRCV